MIIIKKEESCKLKPYYCSEEYPTIGWGCRIGNKYEPLPNIEWTQSKANETLANMVAANLKTILSNPDLSKAYKRCGEVQREVFESMAYQVGIYGVCNFKKFLAALEKGDFPQAAWEMMDSLAARQAPARWLRQSIMMASDKRLNYYMV